MMITLESAFRDMCAAERRQRAAREAAANLESARRAAIDWDAELNTTFAPVGETLLAMQRVIRECYGPECELAWRANRYVTTEGRVVIVLKFGSLSLRWHIAMAAGEIRIDIPDVPHNPEAISLALQRAVARALSDFVPKRG